MAERMQIPMREPVQAHKELMRAWSEYVKPMLIAGHLMVLTVGPSAKSSPQERKYHAMLGEVAAQAQHAGSRWRRNDWKRLLIDKFARETGREPGNVVGNLDFSGVVELGVQSRNFSVADAAEFTEWLHAWGADNGVTFSDSERAQ